MRQGRSNERGNGKRKREVVGIEEGDSETVKEKSEINKPRNKCK